MIRVRGSEGGELGYCKGSGIKYSRRKELEFVISMISSHAVLTVTGLICKPIKEITSSCSSSCTLLNLEH